MRERAWVWGWVTVCVLLAFYYSERVTDVFGNYAQPAYCQTGPKKEDARSLTQEVSAVENKGPAEISEQTGPNGTQCIQWRSTKAAERQAYYAFVGAWLLLLAFIASVAAVVATWRTYWTTRDTAERQLRAYISIEPKGISPSHNNTKVLAHVAIRNAGGVPARDVSWRIDSKICARPDLDVPDLKIGELSRTAVAIPGVELIRGAKTDHTNEQVVDAARVPEKWFYIWGIVRYDDGYGTRRWTRFCHRYNCGSFVLHEDGGISIPADKGRHHERGNDVDKNGEPPQM